MEVFSGRGILIIGAGELGSRHLQGLLKLSGKQFIFVLDPSRKSLGIARKRANEIDHCHSVNFVLDWKGLPKELRLVIVATRADIRAEVVSRLLTGFQVDFLVLEKILFQDLESYEKVGVLLERAKTDAWVNHPRRMFPHYRKIKDELRKSSKRVILDVVGGDWGLACNGLHFIDLLSFLTNSCLDEIDFDWVDDEIHYSKRKGNIEFTGSVKGKMANNSCFIITSLEEVVSEVSIYISSGSQRWAIYEGNAQKISHFSNENQFNEVITEITTELQSDLTTKIASDLLQSGICNLASYKDACASHLPFMEASLRKYNKITGGDSNICPIT